MLLQRHSWVWTVLPPESRRVRVVGDPEMTAVLKASGLTLVDADNAPPEPDAVIIGSAVYSDEGFRRALRAFGASPLIALAMHIPEPQQWSAWRHVHRFGELVRSPSSALAMRARAFRLARLVRKAGFQASIVPTGAPWRRHVIGSGSWRCHRHLPVGAIVIGSLGPPPPGTTGAAVTVASELLGRQLEPVTRMVLESGKILQEITDSRGNSYIQRIAAGPPEREIVQSQRALGLLRDAEPPPVVRDRVMWPICDGRVGVAHFTVEAKAAGASTMEMTDTLWSDCFEFLVALHNVKPGSGVQAGDPAVWSRFEQIVEELSRYLEPHRRPRLVALVQRIRDEVGDLEVGWGHGDFWTNNLVSQDGRLSAVVDWDWSSPHSLPLFDLFELTAMPTHASAIPLGRRVTRVMWRLIDAGGDNRIRLYCEAVGIQPRDRLMKGLIAAYWLDRVVRELDPFWGRTQDRAWMRDNVQRPLDVLAKRWT